MLAAQALTAAGSGGGRRGVAEADAVADGGGGALTVALARAEATALGAAIHFGPRKRAASRPPANSATPPPAISSHVRTPLRTLRVILWRGAPSRVHSRADASSSMISSRSRVPRAVMRRARTVPLSGGGSTLDGGSPPEGGEPAEGGGGGCASRP